MIKAYYQVENTIIKLILKALGCKPDLCIKILLLSDFLRNKKKHKHSSRMRLGFTSFKSFILADDKTFN